MNTQSHFSKAVIKSLATKGYVIVAPVAIPGANGSWETSTTGYKLIRNGNESSIKSYMEVKALAQ
jgi:hypothetical protein